MIDESNELSGVEMTMFNFVAKFKWIEFNPSAKYRYQSEPQIIHEWNENITLLLYWIGFVVSFFFHVQNSFIFICSVEENHLKYGICILKSDLLLRVLSSASCWYNFRSRNTPTSSEFVHVRSLTHPRIYWPRMKHVQLHIFGTKQNIADRID